jgi:hypothetical protein
MRKKTEEMAVCREQCEPEKAKRTNFVGGLGGGHVSVLCGYERKKKRRREWKV